MRTELSDAMKIDLGRGAFLCWFCELNAIEDDIVHTI